MWWFKKKSNKKESTGEFKRQIEYKGRIGHIVIEPRYYIAYLYVNGTEHVTETCGRNVEDLNEVIGLLTDQFHEYVEKEIKIEKQLEDFENHLRETFEEVFE